MFRDGDSDPHRVWPVSPLSFPVSYQSTCLVNGGRTELLRLSSSWDVASLSLQEGQ